MTMRQRNKTNRTVTGLLTLAVAAVAGMAGAVEAQQHAAVVAGIDQYDPNYGPGNLAACVNDANGFADALERDTGRWSSNSITRLLDSQATEGAIRQALQSMADNAQAGDVCVYFQASHGGRYQGKDTYLCSHDADFTDEELGAELARFNAQTTVIVVIDACNSGGMFQRGADDAAGDQTWSFAQNAMASFASARAEEAERTGEALPRDLGANIGFITAANFDQNSQESNGNGVFTRNVLGAMSESAADTTGDGLVSFWEIFSWAAPLATEQSPNQTAQSLNQGLLSGTTATATGNGTGTPTTTPTNNGGEDAFEENDSMQQAQPIGAGTHNLVGLDDDWFVLSHSGGSVVIEMQGQQGDLDLYLADRGGYEVASSTTESSNEALEGDLEAGEYYILVTPYEGLGGNYSLTIRGDTAGPAYPANPSSPTDTGEPYNVPVDAMCGAMGGTMPMLTGLSVVGLIGLGRVHRRRRSR